MLRRNTLSAEEVLEAAPRTKPRVFFFNRSYWPDAEATGQLLTELCEDLAPDFAVTVLAGQPNQNPDNTPFRRHGLENRNGVAIRRVRHTQFEKSSLWGRGLNIVSYLFMAAAAAMFGPRPDMVVVETDPPLLCFLGAALRLRFRCRLVIYLQDLYPDLAVALGKVRPSWSISLLRRLIFAVYRRADRIVVLSRDMQKVLVESGVSADRVAIIPNWIDASEVRPIKQGNPLRKEWNPDNRFVVMYSGNMGLCQGLDDVIRAAELLRDQPEILFLLVGDGSSRRRIQDLAGRLGLTNVRFLSYQSKRDLGISLSAADLHLVPVDSRVYNYLMPSKLYGVLASGTPLLAVAPAESELAELTLEAEVGLVVAPHDPRALADAIGWCSTHRTALDAMGARARRLAESRFDRRQITRKFSEMLASIGDVALPASNAAVHVISEPRSTCDPFETKRMSFLNDRRILVTGGAGFLGRPLCRALTRMNPAVVVAPRSREYDLRLQPDVRRLIETVRPQVVIHLAAVVGGIGANRDNPGRYFYENAIMGIQLMEECRLAGVEKFVALGSICSYPKHTPVPFRESDLWNGYPEETNAPYGLAKKMLLVQAQAYRQQYDFNAITLLPVNLYGPGDNFDLHSSHVIPALIRKAIEARDAGADHIDVWGTGSASREFLFVRDAARAITMAADAYESPEPVNLGSGQEITIRELTTLICDLCGFRGAIHWDASKPDGQPRRCLDTTRAMESFGFQAATSLRDGLAETIAWYEKHRDEPVAEQSPPADTSAPAGKSAAV